MGHYASEMQLNVKPSPSKPEEHEGFVIDSKFPCVVMTCKEFLASKEFITGPHGYRVPNQAAWYELAQKKRFDTKKDAEKFRKSQLKTILKSLKVQVNKYERLLEKL